MGDGRWPNAPAERRRPLNSGGLCYAGAPTTFNAMNASSKLLAIAVVSVGLMGAAMPESAQVSEVERTQAEAPVPQNRTSPQPAWLDSARQKLERELIENHGEAQAERVRRGLHQVAQFWRSEDGDQAAFEAFIHANFAGDQPTLDKPFERFERPSAQL